MAMGFFLIKFSPPLARRLRQEFNHLWIVAEIVLFVLMGATIQLKILADVLLPGLVLLILGLLLGRTVGWYLATARSNWTWKEKLFLLPGNSAKATVQAAIGGIPLGMGIPGGDIILAIAALSILVTAPLGAWAIPTFAPKLLTQDSVDPAQANVVPRTVILGVVESDSAKAIAILAKIADFARRTDGEAIIVCVAQKESNAFELELLVDKLLIDIPHQSIGTVETRKELLHLIQKNQVTEIIIAQPKLADEDDLSSVFSPEFIMKNSNIPVILIG